jgi:hypothetical protein
MGIPVGDLSPRGTGMGKKCSPQTFVGIPAGKFFRRGDGNGELFPGGEFPVAIPTRNREHAAHAVLCNNALDRHSEVVSQAQPARSQ